MECQNIEIIIIWLLNFLSGKDINFSITLNNRILSHISKVVQSYTILKQCEIQ